MKIGIDVHSIGSGKGGNETYYRYLLSGLSAIDAQNEYRLYGTRQSVDQLAGRLPWNFHLQPMASRSPYMRIPFALPLTLRRERVDLFHVQFIVPPGLKCKTVAAIFDITYEHFPEAFPAYQRMWSKALIRSSARRADHIVTLSEHSKQDIARTYGIDEDKITVTPLGAADDFYPRDRSAAKELLERKCRIKDDFVLYLGRLQARKNLVRLVEAYAQVRRAGFPHKLVLAGKPDFLFEPVLARIRELKLDNHILIPGYLQAEHIPFLYSAADLFVFPSLYEGFGLPVIEAMACGAPVVTSRGSSLEEVAGDAALLVDPLDQDALAQTIRLALLDDGLRDRLRQAGLRQSAKFSAERTARTTIAVYEALLGINRPQLPRVAPSPATTLRDFY